MKSGLKLINLILIIIAASAPLYSSNKSINSSLLKIINSDGDELSCTVSQDRRQIIFARKPKGAQSSDLFIAEYKKGKWTEPKAMTELNSDADDFSPFLSNNGKTIYFSSNRQGSLKSPGSTSISYDIYYSEKKNGKWGKPEQIFGAVNTMDDEYSPSLSRDGKTLHFTRETPGAQGKTQIIKVTKKNDSWEDVQTAKVTGDKDLTISSAALSYYRPLYIISGYKTGSKTRDIFYSPASSNSGELTEAKELNSDGDEISFCEISSSIILISSNSSGIAGSYDFFIKKIPEEVKSAVTPSDITIRTESGTYQNPAGINISILYFITKDPGAEPVKKETIQPDQNGNIKLTITSDIKRILAIPGNPDMKEFAVEIIPGKENTAKLITIESKSEKEFRLRPVYFEFNSPELRIADIPYIHEVIDHLRKNENKKISIEGYADGAGTLKANTDISFARAERVKDYLVKHGINKKRIKTAGHGFIKEAPSDTTQYNRRVEFVITE